MEDNSRNAQKFSLWPTLRNAIHSEASIDNLTFKHTDDIAYAAQHGGLGIEKLRGKFETQRLGPLLEILQLAQASKIPAFEEWLPPSPSLALVQKINSGFESWISPSKTIGFIRAIRSGNEADLKLDAFLMKAKRAGWEIAGMPKEISGQIVAALKELESNIHEHSKSTGTGLIAFSAINGIFEFVVCDQGIGLLKSLRECEAHDQITDHGMALRAALTDGTTRYGPNSLHGNGFRPIFTGLANLRGELRFRTGDHAMLLNGDQIDRATAQLVQKPFMSGFLANVLCHCDRSSG